MMPPVTDDDRVPLNYKVRPIIKTRIRQLARQLGLNETSVVATAVNELFSRYESAIAASHTDED